ncbi:hypothetical protein KSK32_32310 [Micromonospora sp. WMMB482]|nr:hypothetical protein [Micromonospora sp. WMMB482]MBU8861876.1 hypothetical protein [Micromonospora sp. WMMB482]
MYALSEGGRLRPDGIVGAKTRAALDDGRRRTPAAPAATSPRWTWNGKL